MKKLKKLRKFSAGAIAIATAVAMFVGFFILDVVYTAFIAVADDIGRIITDTFSTNVVIVIVVISATVFATVAVNRMSKRAYHRGRVDERNARDDKYLELLSAIKREQQQREQRHEHEQHMTTVANANEFLYEVIYDDDFV